MEEIETDSGNPAGVVHAFSIDQTTGELTRLNHQPSGGTVSCHLSVDSTGRYVLFANYGSGSVGMLPIRDDGSLDEMSDFVQHEGSGVDANRQKGPHAHSINVDPTNRYAFVPDLGLDKVFAYRLDLDGGRLIPHDPPSASTAPGAGPRHFDFHPTDNYAYLINELDSTMTAFEYDPSAGALSEINTVSTLPADFTGASHCADVHVHPSGRFVYGYNRGHNSIRDLRDRWGDRRAHVPGHRVDPWGVAAQLRHRPDGRVPAGRQPGQRHGGDLPHRPADRHAGADRPDDPGTDAGVPETHSDAVTAAVTASYAGISKITQNKTPNKTSITSPTPSRASRRFAPLTLRQYSLRISCGRYSTVVVKTVLSTPSTINVPRSSILNEMPSRTLLTANKMTMSPTDSDVATPAPVARFLTTDTW